MFHCSLAKLTHCVAFSVWLVISYDDFSDSVSPLDLSKLKVELCWQVTVTACV